MHKTGDHSLAAGFRTGMISFTVDTSTITYEPYHESGGIISNSGSAPLYGCWVLRTDANIDLKLEADIAGSRVDTLQVPKGKAIPFTLTFTTSLIPGESDLYGKAQAIGYVMKKEKGNYFPIDSTILNFTVKFPMSLDTAPVVIKPQIVFSVKPDQKPDQFIFTLTAGGNTYIVLEIYDEIGRMKAQVTEGVFTGGTKDFKYNGSGLEPGKYFARLHAGSERFTRQIMIN